MQRSEEGPGRAQRVDRHPHFSRDGLIRGTVKAGPTSLSPMQRLGSLPPGGTSGGRITSHKGPDPDTHFVQAILNTEVPVLASVLDYIHAAILNVVFCLLGSMLYMDFIAFVLFLCLSAPFSKNKEGQTITP